MKRWREKIWWSKSEKVLLLYQVKVWEKSKPKCHFRVWNQNSIQFQTCQICNWFASEFTGHKHKSIILTSTFHSAISIKPVGCETQECFTTVNENDEEIPRYCNIHLLYSCWWMRVSHVSKADCLNEEILWIVCWEALKQRQTTVRMLFVFQSQVDNS